MSIELRVNIAGGQQALVMLQGQIANLTPALTAIKEVALTSIRTNFAQGGRPTPWQALSRPRLRGNISSAIPLSDTGRLRASITGEVNDGTITLGTNVVYARAHQLGATIQIPEMVIQPPRRAFRFTLKDGTVLYRKRIRAHSIVLPARPFMMIQEEDIEIFVKILQSHLTKGLS